MKKTRGTKRGLPDYDLVKTYDGKVVGVGKREAHEVNDILNKPFPEATKGYKRWHPWLEHKYV